MTNTGVLFLTRIRLFIDIPFMLPVIDPAIAGLKSGKKTPRAGFLCPARIQAFVWVPRVMKRRQVVNAKAEPRMFVKSSTAILAVSSAKQNDNTRCVA
jgi:hypothetical protein